MIPFFNLILDNKKYTGDSYLILFKKYWNTEYDWFINALLLAKFEVSSIEMTIYTPQNIEEWRKEKKNEYSELWNSKLRICK